MSNIETISFTPGLPMCSVVSNILYILEPLEPELVLDL